MARFCSFLETRKDHTGKWRRLLSPLLYWSDILQDYICVPTAFYTDFASVPRIPVVYSMFKNHFEPPSVLHDFGYCKDAVTWSGHPLPKDIIDLVFREACGAWRPGDWRIEPVYKAVAWFGAGSYHKRRVNWVPDNIIKLEVKDHEKTIIRNAA